MDYGWVGLTRQASLFHIAPALKHSHRHSEKATYYADYSPRSRFGLGVGVSVPEAEKVWAYASRPSLATANLNPACLT